MTEKLLGQLAYDAKKVLGRGYRVQERIEAKQERIAFWQQIAESITANPENSSGGNSYPQSKIEKCVCEISDLKSEIMDDILMLAQYESEARQIIKDYACDPNYKAVLELRYCNHLKWEEIAIRMGYTYNWVQELHKRAIQEVESMSRQKNVY